jgi:ribosomal protein RSM22 (predicted rRNA methylase)
MKFQLKQILENTLVENISESKLIKILNLISKGFTSDRDKISTYVNDREYVSAYTSFYLPTNIPKLSFLLDQLPDDFISNLKGSKIVDFGTGPGTFAFAFDEYFEGDIEVLGVDQSILMIEQAKKLNSNLYKNSNISFSTNLPDQLKNGTLFFGHSLNEMGAKNALKLIDDLGPKNIILIEPGTSSLFNEVLKLRKSLSVMKYSCVYPCASISLRCPVEQKINDGKVDWCHQVIRTTHDQEVERLSQLIKLDRKVMPLISHVYTLNKVEINKSARMIRFLRETKFSFDWEVCLLEDSNLKTIQFEVVKKSLSKKEIKALQKISVGLEFDFEILKVLNEELYRVKLVDFNY